MSRFQAKTSPALEEELDELRRQLSLRENQKAELLRELAELASWVVHQVSAGRSVVARGSGEVRELEHPALERIRRQRRHAGAQPAPLKLDGAEVMRLASILEEGFRPTSALVRTLSGLADPDRRPPSLTWTDHKLRLDE